VQFPFFQNKRKQILAEPFPDDWNRILDNNVRLFGLLNADEQARLRDITKVLVREKNWEGCRGLEMTDEVRVTIAAQAAMLLLGIDHDYFANVQSILVYPAGYSAKKTVTDGRFVSEVRDDRLGEAWSGDLPVILSWPDALDGGRNVFDGRNVVLHEFAHKLDNRDGTGDGVPRLGSRQEYDRWSEVMTREFELLTYLASTGQPSLLNQYGATSPAEFFAVTTECFFERPLELRRYHPDLYTIFKDFYRQDPVDRIRWQP
jgi:hypothetical protein